MRIAVLGSIDADSEKTQKFKSACRDIGNQLSKRGYQVIVCSENQHTADPHIIDGINDDEKNRTRVEIIRSEEEDKLAPFYETREKYKNIEFTFSRCSGGWKTTHLKAIINSDLLLTIGGKDSVWVAANSARMLNKPVVCIPCFDGTSRKLWEKLSDEYRKTGIDESVVGQIREQWGDESKDSLEKLIVSVFESNKAEYASSKILTYLTIFCLSLVFIVGWISLFSLENLAPGRISVMTMVVICSIMGVMLRGITSDRYSHNWNEFWASLIPDAIKGILIGFILALVHLFSELTINGSISDLSDKSSFIRISLSISLIAILAGFALDKSLDKVEKLAEDKISDLGK
ncbi:hypothetical protein [Methylomonas albis]|uniref:Uncharacterized protein n=1 Tax=Methylomonas albis TaxID=1854563 RepID=A0ABR9D751_9GAMM|nr:hypothetical protein [Methylomonas albis]MBD9358933.1 hypothetical protein [Methylomonas albis]